MNIRWLEAKIRRQAGFWLVPAAYILIALVLGRFTPQLDPFLFPNYEIFSTNLAVSMLSAILSGMITFTGFVFSMIFLLVQFGSNAYSPRLIEFLLHDRVVRHALGMFIATFLYSLMSLIALDVVGQGLVPDMMIILALLAVLGSVIMFLALIQRVTVLQVSNVLHMVGDQGREVIERTFPNQFTTKDDNQADESTQVDESTQADQKPSGSDLSESRQSVIYRGRPMAILYIDFARLVTLAREADGVIKVNYPVGDTVSDGARLLEVCGGRRSIDERRLSRTIELGTQRTIKQDPKYAIRLMVDIAIKALSPGINDPTTAVQALDQLSDLLFRIGNRSLTIGDHHDRAGKLRVVSPAPDWEDFLDLALDEIRYYGATSVQVMRRLRALLQDLEDGLPEERRELVNHHLKRVDSSIRHSFKDLEDREDAGQADRQGIGLTRDEDD